MLLLLGLFIRGAKLENYRNWRGGGGGGGRVVNIHYLLVLPKLISSEDEIKKQLSFKKKLVRQKTQNMNTLPPPTTN